MKSYLLLLKYKDRDGGITDSWSIHDDLQDALLTKQACTHASLQSSKKLVCSVILKVKVKDYGCPH